MKLPFRLWLAIALVALFSTPGWGEEAPGENGSLTFERDVRPILRAHCFECHGDEAELEGSLDVRLRRLIEQGGESGSALAVGNRADSLIYQRVAEEEMPPGDKKLTDEEIALVGRWIDQGAKTAAPEPTELTSGFSATAEDRQFWSFQPIIRAEEPTVEHADLVRTPVDSFLLARLEERGWAFSPEADRRTLVRRACFDLTGLPPTVEQVELFLADEGPGAYERLLDRLLASPHYGERWGRHWLDTAGYADSEGRTNEDPVRPNAYKYRDYVIRSINADKPFDLFIKEQLAGDEMIEPPYENLTADETEKLVATGFLRMAADGTASGGVDQGVTRNAVVADTIQIVSTSLLGLTVACAQCHDHRYDPISQSDYYQMRAIFEPAYDWKNWRNPKARLVSLYTDADRAKAAEIEAAAVKIDAARNVKQKEYIEQTFQKELAKLPEEIREPIRAAREMPADKRTPEQTQLLKDNPSVNVTSGSLYLYDKKAADDLKKQAEQAAEVRATKPVEEFVRSLTEVPDKVPLTYLFDRGDHEQPKAELLPAGLSIVETCCPQVHEQGPILANDPALPTTGRRLEYARRLTDGTHPLTARVLVNSIWMHHFGRGIVATPGDFGALGEKPTHPKLLDYLASEFANGGWRLKRLHKMIMLSTAYRQISRPDSAKRSADPDNRLLGWAPLRRLEAEVLRDAILATSGVLNRKMFGTPVPIMEDEVGQVVVGIDTTDSAGRPTGKFIPLDGEEFRRSIYVQVRRSKPLAVLDTFDAPMMEPNCSLRSASTVAPQALLLMNSEFSLTQAKHFAHRVRREAGNDPRQQAAHAWRQAFVATASEEELDDAVKFLAEQKEQFLSRASDAIAAGEKKDEEKGEEQQANQVNEAEHRALASLCHALMSSNRFLYVD